MEQLGAPGFYHVIARYGYTQRVHQVLLHNEITQKCYCSWRCKKDIELSSATLHCML